MDINYWVLGKEFCMFGWKLSLTGNSGPGWQSIKVCSMVVTILLCAGIAFSVGGCKKQEQKAAGEKSVNVRVWTVETRPLRPFVESIGTLKPHDEVTVSSELDGILKTIHVDEGSFVSRGQLIAEIKDTDYRLAEEQATAMLKQAQAGLANAKLDY
jgi:membrane fusion protein, multidrug efflux system